MQRFEVLSPGLFTTLQDLGRFGFEDQGVPPAGAMDEFSAAIANALVDNPADTGVLELTLTGPSLRLVGDAPVWVALTGHLAINLNGEPQAGYQCFTLLPGDILSIPRVLSGARGYLAVAGGFRAEPVMGSVSTLMRAGLGGFAGRQLIKGDSLPLLSSRKPPAINQLTQRILPQQERRPVRVVWGPQDDYFSREAKRAFTTNSWTLSNQCDRMGYRLSGPPIPHINGFNIVSDAIARGSIQIPGNGQPIVAMNDRQTTGGYPKIATIIRADHARMGQFKPGDKLSFETVSVEKAEDLWRGRQALFQQWVQTIRAGE
ncbi:biotin-dependent carboxyltransferase family protein [Pantoea sp. BAV 3049]|uniref:5-oxoprolinase subunit C family protein n=1 Tax=Pantoea sp. BAV 3049 TaxID=2654188 RepID=UPI00131A6263|nr:biotin-dependent carboxyltransferase family protein [Pantoea sp. BAV 3049]